jgi:hypothetical protein
MHKHEICIKSKIIFKVVFQITQFGMFIFFSMLPHPPKHNVIGVLNFENGPESDILVPQI